nr:hypothetical protein [Tanacetum cinerariifolium]
FHPGSKEAESSFIKSLMSSNMGGGSFLKGLPG